MLPYKAATAGSDGSTQVFPSRIIMGTLPFAQRIGYYHLSKIQILDGPLYELAVYVASYWMECSLIGNEKLGYDSFAL